MLGGSSFRWNDKCCRGERKEIPAFAGIEMRNSMINYVWFNTFFVLYLGICGFNTPIPAKAGISLYPLLLCHSSESWNLLQDLLFL